MLRDAVGRSFDFDQPPRRVVSLVPSLTETLFDLGAGDAVVGITNYCIFPTELDVPRVGGTKNPDVEAIRGLAPDLVDMNLEENLPRHAREIERFAPVFVTEPRTIVDVVALITTLGAIHRRSERAAELLEDLRGELSNARRQVFTFACPIWKKPWMWCGGDTYVANLVAAAGGVNVLQNKSRYPQSELEVIAAMKPEVVLVPDEPYAFSEDEAAEIGERTGARIIGPFPGHLVTWHGARTIAGLRFLRETLALSPAGR